MSGFARHYRARLSVTLRRPLALSLFALLVLLTGLLWPGVDPPVARSGAQRLQFAIVLLTFAELLAGIVGGRAKPGLAGGFFPRTIMPALPVHPVARAAAVLAAIVTLGVLVQFVAALALLPFTGYELTFPGWASIWDGPRGSLLHAATGWLVMLPSLLAASLPHRQNGHRYARSYGVGAVTGALYYFDWLADPLAVLLFCGLGCAALIAVNSSGQAGSARARSARKRSARPAAVGGSRRSLSRPGLHPEQRLRRDLLAGAGRNARVLLVALVATLPLALALDHVPEAWAEPLLLPDGRMFWWAFPAGLTAFMVAMAPFGRMVGAGDPTGRDSHHRRLFARTWASLPVRPILVLRLVYAHALATGLLSIPAIVLTLASCRYAVGESFELLGPRPDLALVCIGVAAVVAVVLASAVVGGIAGDVWAWLPPVFLAIVGVPPVAVAMLLDRSPALAFGSMAAVGLLLCLPGLRHLRATAQKGRALS